MKPCATLLAVFVLSLTMLSADAEAARRLGGGKSSGMQRESISAQKHTPAPASTPTPTQSQAHPSPAQSASAAPAPATQGKRSWMGPLAGLAAGLGLAALASHFGFGEGLATMLLVGLLVVVAIAVVGFIMRRRAPVMQPATAGAPWASQPATPEPSNVSAYTAPEPVPASAPPAAAKSIPADFDVEGFLRQAKVSFLRLQAANDARNLDDIREFTTPEMFGEIKAAIMERGAAAQETDVTSLEAQCLDVSKDETRHIVSVRFTGSASMDRGAQIETIDEIWHIVKPLAGSQGWMLAGIQQIQ